jgi:hypothetical protein
MESSETERRTRRSQRAEEALSLQLERVRDEAHLEALVLASEEGLTIAHSGEEEFCTELAALAPFIEQANSTQELLRVRATEIAGRQLYLVSYGRDRPREVESWLDHAFRGVTRILSFAL